MKQLITKNDIWRILGIILLIAGQFFNKENFSGFGVVMETNLVQIVGAILLLLPFLLKGLAIYKDKKQASNDDMPQA